MFVPIRMNPKPLTAARKGDSGKGLPSRPFSASAGATVLVTGLVVVSYILATLSIRLSKHTADHVSGFGGFCPAVLIR
jgi:hypothetical protein